MTNFESLKASAIDALDSRNFEAAVTFASALVDAGDPWLLDGLMFRSAALEHWAEGPRDRLADAVNDWKRLIEIAPGSIPYRGLARVLLKLGDRESALLNLLEAERRAKSPEIYLGFAQYYRTASPPDLEKAKGYYLRAALRGRTQGMRGYGEAAYDLDQPLLAASTALLGLLAMPFLALFLGKRRHDGF